MSKLRTTPRCVIDFAGLALHVDHKNRPYRRVKLKEPFVDAIGCVLCSLSNEIDSLEVARA